MARTETILTAFVASPGDVADEREILEDVIQELNVTWRKTLGVSIEVLKWETHATPGTGNDSQKVINAGIGSDFDIFLGIMWSRFGTATSTHESGTEEEYSIAFEKWKNDPSSVRVMFYFNQQGVSMDQLDPEQAAKIKAFKKSLGEEGQLYWNYKDKENFQEIVRLHLSRVIQDWIARPSSSLVSAKPLPGADTAQNDAVSEEDELGFFDLQESLEDSIEAISDVAERLGVAIGEVGDDMNSRGAELNELERDGKDVIVDHRAAKRITNRAAQDLDRFNSSLQSDIPVFKDHTSIIARSSSGLALVFTDFDQDSDEGLAQLASMLTTLIESIETVPENMIGFRDTVAGAAPNFS